MKTDFSVHIHVDLGVTPELVALVNAVIDHPELLEVFLFPSFLSGQFHQILSITLCIKTHFSVTSLINSSTALRSVFLLSLSLSSLSVAVMATLTTPNPSAYRGRELQRRDGWRTL